MGEAAGRWSDILVVTSDNPRTENPDKIIEDILPGLTGINYQVIVDRRKAIACACSIAAPGDTIVIAGKGHEDYQIIGTEKIHFDDREEVSVALKELGYNG
jgi:UDP-N-acetylmuramoyl-L-alanyl-D-glutamate--2,6-diaminopimelate ligase